MDSYQAEKAAPRDVIGHIDGTEGSLPDLIILGWSFSRVGKISGVEVLHGKDSLAVGQLGERRPDVAAAYPTEPCALHSGFRVAVDTSELSHEFELDVFVVGDGGRRYPIGSVSKHPGSGISKRRAAEGEVKARSRTPTLKGKLRDLILRAAESAGSEIDLTEPERAPAVVERLALEGRRVLVLGAGLGELCRAARSRGAALVDCIELDPARIRLARLLNAYWAATRISLYQGNLSDPSSYRDSYDVALALGTLSPAAPALSRLTEKVGVLVAEMAPSDEPLLDQELNRLFRFHSEVQLGEHTPPNPLVIALANDEGLLRDVLRK